MPTKRGGAAPSAPVNFPIRTFSCKPVRPGQTEFQLDRGSADSASGAERCVHSYRSARTGFAVAARTAWMLTVAAAIATKPIATAVRCHHGIPVL